MTVAPGAILGPYAILGLIRLRGRFPKGGYDVYDMTTASAVHGGFQSGRRAVGARRAEDGWGGSWTSSI